MYLTARSDVAEHDIGAIIPHTIPDGSQIAVLPPEDTQKRKYTSQIEEEVLVLVFPVSKCHKMLCSRHFTLYLDERSLLVIFGAKKAFFIT